MGNSMTQTQLAPGTIFDQAEIKDAGDRLTLCLVTDAWYPQVNGVVRTWDNVRRECEQMGHRFEVIHPALFNTCPLPKYPEIKLALKPYRHVKHLMGYLAPDVIHIATEGPLGQAARRFCLKRDLPFTTSYHTQFPQYVRQYTGLPESIAYALMRKFHGAGQATLVPTPNVKRELDDQGFKNVVVWTRGVDTSVFKPEPKHVFDLPRPIYLYAGRVALEKNIEAFLGLDLPGSKVVVGDGPAKAGLQTRYPDVHWAGYRFGPELAAHYAGADVFVFPSKTDTFGVVMLEANACGLPVAAYPVTGPIDVVKPGRTGALDEDLGQACRQALNVSKQSCLDYAAEHTWRRCAQMVLDHARRIPRSERLGL